MGRSYQNIRTRLNDLGVGLRKEELPDGQSVLVAFTAVLVSAGMLTLDIELLAGRIGIAGLI